MMSVRAVLQAYEFLPARAAPGRECRAHSTFESDRTTSCACVRFGSATAGSVPAVVFATLRAGGTLSIRVRRMSTSVG
jgi:hypothetical protein